MSSPPITLPLQHSFQVFQTIYKNTPTIVKSKKVMKSCSFLWDLSEDPFREHLVILVSRKAHGDFEDIDYLFLSKDL